MRTLAALMPTRRGRLVTRHGGGLGGIRLGLRVYGGECPEGAGAAGRGGWDKASVTKGRSFGRFFQGRRGDRLCWAHSNPRNLRDGPKGWVWFSVQGVRNGKFSKRKGLEVAGGGKGVSGLAFRCSVAGFSGSG